MFERSENAGARESRMMFERSENAGARESRMMKVGRTLVLLPLVGLLASCNPIVTNTADVYPPVSGAADLKLNVTATGIKTVEFSLDGTSIGQDADPTDGFSVELDSTKFANGLHVLRAIARDSSGEARQTIEHAILFQN